MRAGARAPRARGSRERQRTTAEQAQASDTQADPLADPLTDRLEKLLCGGLSKSLQLVDVALCPYNMMSLNPSSQKPKEMLFVRMPDSNNGKHTKAGLPKSGAKFNHHVAPDNSSGVG